MNAGTGDRVAEAFERDGFVVAEQVERSGSRGVLARSRADPERTALYLEGDAYTQGYLTGLLAAPYVERMAGEYVDNVIPAFISGRTPRSRSMRRLKRLLADLLRENCMRVYDRHPGDVPQEYLDEMEGIAAGCRAVSPGTRVSFDELFLMNLGIDFLLAYVYTGVAGAGWLRNGRPWPGGVRGLAAGALLGARPAHLRVPLGCNAFWIGPELAEGRAGFLGRDFMFPNAGVFQDTSCLMVRVPRGEAQPTVSVSAPGMVGAATVMNARGLALGVNMVAGAWCDPHRPGLNSLLLIRSVAERARGLEHALGLIEEAPRGVAWLYVLADAASGSAAVVEAGARDAASPGIAAVRGRYRRVLERSGVGAIPAPPRGFAVRRPGDSRPPVPAAANRALFAAALKAYDPAAQEPEGRFHVGGSAPWRARVLPGPLHFPPPRIEEPRILAAANQYLTAAMRVSSMAGWVSRISASREDDFQWRYDELCSRLRGAAARSGRISVDEARELIDFLSPRGSWPAYYERNVVDARGPRIEGAVALCDLGQRRMHAYFGWYDGCWLRLSLPAYLPRSLSERAPAPRRIAGRSGRAPRSERRRRGSASPA